MVKQDDSFEIVLKRDDSSKIVFNPGFLTIEDMIALSCTSNQLRKTLKEQFFRFLKIPHNISKIMEVNNAAFLKFLGFYELNFYNMMRLTILMQRLNLSDTLDELKRATTHFQYPELTTDYMIINNQLLKENVVVMTPTERSRFFRYINVSLRDKDSIYIILQCAENIAKFYPVNHPRKNESIDLYIFLLAKAEKHVKTSYEISQFISHILNATKFSFYYEKRNEFIDLLFEVVKKGLNGESKTFNDMDNYWIRVLNDILHIMQYVSYPKKDEILELAISVAKKCLNEAKTIDEIICRVHNILDKSEFKEKFKIDELTQMVIDKLKNNITDSKSLKNIIDDINKIIDIYEEGITKRFFKSVVAKLKLELE